MIMSLQLLSSFSTEFYSLEASSFIVSSLKKMYKDVITRTHLVSYAIKHVVDRVDPGCSLSDGSHSFTINRDRQSLGAVRVERGAAAALAAERSQQSDHLLRGLVCDAHVELSDVATHHPEYNVRCLLHYSSQLWRKISSTSIQLLIN